MFHRDTIVAIATPPLESALAIVRLSGPTCTAIAQEAFARKATLISRRVSVGVYHDVAGRRVDECVYVLFGDTFSFTGEASLEITCHGNPLITRQILDDCLARGCRLAAPGEFTRRAFLNGRLDLTQAEAVADTIHARSHKALAVAQRQLAGELLRRVVGWTDRLLQVQAALEAYIDFPEEDLPPEDVDGPLAALLALAGEFSRAAGSARYAGVLRNGVRVVIVGAPNAGKSSLLNALLGEERALVSDEPGTTRDFICEHFVVGAHSVQLVDTAGLRGKLATRLETLGMARTHDQVEGADFCLLVVDAAASPPVLPAGLLQMLDPAHALLVLNKSDLPANEQTAGMLPGYLRATVSARTGVGIEAFKVQLAETLERGGIVPDGESIVVNARHAEALRRCAEHLEKAAAAIRQGVATELAASDVRMAVSALGEIIGRVETEQMLDKLFASFCIGK
ncbi:MAG: tRNA uridine-5-carboxymethylaminomethyl(34) synthesis GTPase MnmE [Puniceicoccales bacterium]|jgi:tRNA modification GTPase|nr:tRNA uridine-5-carboxymethylaminomethyl(34) synthesis GTPase MnmE [Puniceicoccales bacterium]